MIGQQVQICSAVTAYTKCRWMLMSFTSECAKREEESKDSEFHFHNGGDTIAFSGCWEA